MQIKTATIIGSSGMTGSYLLNVLSQDKSIETIRLIVRHPVPKRAGNVEVKLVNFEDAQAFKNAVAGSDVVFCAIGTTQKNVKGDKDLYRKIDYDIPVNAAQYCKETGCEKFIVVSAVGASNKSSNFYLRLKGEMEDAVKASGVQSIHIMQPSMLLGHRNEKRTGEAFFQRLIKGLSFLLIGGLKKYTGIPAKQLALAMVAAAKENSTGIFTHQYKEIIQLVK
ncbi:NAD(P)H-binding protein [Ferruginibacter sp.]|uniref:NAD(P)H-binding protein n=1 Tax=Ferruginibacter sp. TaxID=1940288 RepID=UPI00198BEBEE|nr:NAD(P)H-binding protein [Ferruginibacter sp.]MBC7628987.1 NAD(P)H-binding protein [Ferruginibacter sp.]